MREWLNGVFYQALPDELKAVISERTFKTSIGNQGSALQEATDKIWIPKEWEVFGTQTYATATEHTSDTAQFPIYAVASNGKNLWKIWWFSVLVAFVSALRATGTTFCNVTTAGAANRTATRATRMLWPPCFQISFIPRP